jgi:integrase
MEDLLSKGNGTEYASACRRKVRDTLQGLNMPQQITALAVDENIKFLRKVGVAQPAGSKRRRKPYTPQSCNDCLAKTKQFCSWLVKQGGMRVNPLVAMQGFTREVVSANRAHPRGVLTLEQQRALLEKTAASTATRGGMTGKQRADLYRLVLQTGLRAYEAASLRVHWFDLAERTLTLPVDVVKTRREDVIFLRADLIPVIERNTKGKAPTDYLFPHVHEDSLVDLLREDLKAAEIATVTLSQKHIDFYSLRHTYGTEMSKIVKTPVLQQLMRHKSVQTTLKYYVHIDMNDAASAVDLGPVLDAPRPMLKAAG